MAYRLTYYRGQSLLQRHIVECNSAEEITLQTLWELTNSNWCTVLTLL